MLLSFDQNGRLGDRELHDVLSNWEYELKDIYVDLK